MKKNVPIVIYRNWLATFTALPSEAVGDIVKALSVHVITGGNPTLSDELEVLKSQLFTEVDESLSKYYAKCVKNKQTAEEREAKKAQEEQARATDEERTLNERDTNVTRTSGNSKTKTKTKTKTNNSSDEELESVGALSSKPTPARKIIPPKPEWVSKYFNDQGFTSDPSAFFDYWESRGWKTKTGMMKDWEAAARTWNRNEGQFSTPRNPTTPQTQDSATDWDKIAKEVEQLGYFDNVNNHANVFASIPATVREDVGG